MFGLVVYKIGVKIENIGRALNGHDMRLDKYAWTIKQLGRRLIRKGQSIIAKQSDEIPF